MIHGIIKYDDWYKVIRIDTICNSQINQQKKEKETRIDAQQNEISEGFVFPEIQAKHILNGLSRIFKRQLSDKNPDSSDRTNNKI